MIVAGLDGYVPTSMSPRPQSFAMTFRRIFIRSTMSCDQMLVINDLAFAPDS